MFTIWNHIIYFNIFVIPLNGHKSEQTLEHCKDRGAWSASVQGGSQRVRHDLVTEQLIFDVTHF